MDNNQMKQYESIPKNMFEFVTDADYLHDKKLETKPVGYMRDALRRFSKNKSSVAAAVIILILILFAIIGPFCCSKTYQQAYQTDTVIVRYKELLPKLSFMNGTGFWDGSQKKEISLGTYYIYQGMAQETGYNPIQKVIKEKTSTDAFGKVSTVYDVRLNSYYACQTFTMTLTADEYADIQRWQDEHNMQVILPRVNEEKAQIYSAEKSVWYVCDKRGNPTFDMQGNFIPAYYTSGVDDYTSKVRLASDPGVNDNTVENRYRYAQRTGKDGVYNYVVRIGAYNYFQYKYGFEPSFVFGTDSKGFDIFSRLAAGARFSLLLALLVSVVNLTIGAIYGAIEGYYGGAIDMFMERISDILANVPFMVVTVLFKLHLASKVGIVGSLIYAFILTGWIGMASSVRMQFYRFKNQEYVLAARTLGASDMRIIWRHIFPNSIGTIITGSVLVIPGVIFSETSLSYLGIINLDSSTMSSVGSMLSAGQKVLTTAPHVVLFPALFIALLMISFNLFGNGLRDAFNPSLRGSEE